MKGDKRHDVAGCPAGGHSAFHHDGRKPFTGLLQLVGVAEHIEHHPPGSPQAVADHVEGGFGKTAGKGRIPFRHNSPAHLPQGSPPAERLLPGPTQGFERVLHALRCKGNGQERNEGDLIDRWKEWQRLQGLEGSENAGEIDVQEKGAGIVDQVLVLFGLHVLAFHILVLPFQAHAVTRPLVELQVQDIQHLTWHDRGGSAVHIGPEIIVVLLHGLAECLVVVHGIIHCDAGVLVGEESG